ncbi:MAG: hypothetical protein B7Z61_04585 [Acidobacteria bacterium 37-71-11]|nr:MAG: hypothetical protein B7Z61_04585 [Acidobacteria bacterium 37-71-11]HQT93802.1 hypothetical protein [Thermoanaerobaculaceae bacterium]
MKAVVEFAATERAAVMRDVATMATQAVERGARETPRAYLVPPDGDSGRRGHLLRLLLEAGVEGSVAAGPVEADGITYPAGTAVFPAAQPLRQYLLEVMARQRYPEIAPAPDADILLPYDVTAWTMPLELGVRTVPVEGEVAGKLVKVGADWNPSVPAATGAGDVFIVPAGQLGGFAAANRALQRGARVARLAASASAGGTTVPAGSFVIEGLTAGVRDEIAASSGVTGLLTDSRPESAVPLRRVRVGVYHPNFGLEDAGWLRFVLEEASFDVEVVDSAAVASGEFAKRIEVLVLPPLEGKILVEGPRQHGPAPVPPEYRRGIGKEGVEAVRRFFAAGGTVIAFGPAADWLSETLELPVTNTLKGAKREEFRCPGALLELAVDGASPLGTGLGARIAAMVEWRTAFQTKPVVGDQAQTVAAHFPDEPLVLSGWVRGEAKLRRRAAVVEVVRGGGHAVLFAFAPYFRGQTEATFPLLYNAVVERMAREDSPAGEKGSRS